MSLPPCGEEELDSLMSVKVQAPFGARVQKVQKVQRVVVGAFGAIIYAACGGENRTAALAGEEMHSPFGGWRHHLSAPLGSVSLDSQSPVAPCESSSLATAVRWGGKRKAP